jgi:hypothetical protein
MGLSHGLIADIFEVSRGTISLISLGHIWVDVVPFNQKDLVFNIDNKEWAGKAVCLIGKGGEVIKTYESLRKAGADLNLDPTLIGKVASGRFKQYKGMTFKFAVTSEELTLKELV